LEAILEMKELPVRKNIRLKGYNYSNAGAYFITLCIKDGHEILWDAPLAWAAFGRPPLSDTGILIDAEIGKLDTTYDHLQIDKYVIMPNHIHMIIFISDDTHGRPKAAPTISRAINQFKGSVSKQLGYSIWQKLFHDHIIRNEEDYRRISKYIDENPAKWTEDCYYVQSK
jgi:REP element-mobilizing transposase RayT